MEIEGIDNTDSTSDLFDAICKELTRTIEGIGAFQRRFFPPDFSALRKDLLPFRASLNQAKQEFQETVMLIELQQPGKIIAESSGLVLNALEMIITASTTDFQQTVVQVMKAARKICRVQENLYTGSMALSIGCFQFILPKAPPRHLNPSEPMLP